jgi:hypothetical protein
MPNLDTYMRSFEASPTPTDLDTYLGARALQAFVVERTDLHVNAVARTHGNPLRHSADITKLLDHPELRRLILENPRKAEPERPSRPAALDLRGVDYLGTYVLGSITEGSEQLGVGPYASIDTPSGNLHYTTYVTDGTPGLEVRRSALNTDFVGHCLRSALEQGASAEEVRQIFVSAAETERIAKEESIDNLTVGLEEVEGLVTAMSRAYVDGYAREEGVGPIKKLPSFTYETLGPLTVARFNTDSIL